MLVWEYLLLVNGYDYRMWSLFWRFIIRVEVNFNYLFRWRCVSCVKFRLDCSLLLGWVVGLMGCVKVEKWWDENFWYCNFNVWMYIDYCCVVINLWL